MTSPYARGALAWGLALAAGWVLLAAVHYRARDPDSRLYAEISARMAEAPGAGWIAPEFPPGWYMSGLYREHPVGLFVPSAALAALEYPAEQAAYAMNALYQVLGIVLLQRLAATRAPGLEARALGWLIQLLPIAFTFRIRANQEAAVLLCLLAALYGAERASERKCFAVLTAAGLVGLLLVKGILAVFGPALCALWLISRRLAGEQQHGGDRAAWTGIAAGVAAMAAAAAVYEFLYRQATGEPFWSFYLTRQLGVAAATRDASGPISGFAYNLVWYLGRVLWFPFPWSVASALALWRAARSSSARVDVAARAGAVFTLAVVGLYVVLFSFSDRRADRYIFPVYFGVGAAGIVAALRGIPWLGRLAARLDRPWLPAAVWGVAFLAHLVAGRLGLATIKVWAP